MGVGQPRRERPHEVVTVEGAAEGRRPVLGEVRREGRAGRLLGQPEASWRGVARGVRLTLTDALRSPSGATSHHHGDYEEDGAGPPQIGPVYSVGPSQIGMVGARVSGTPWLWAGPRKAVYSVSWSSGGDVAQARERGTRVGPHQTVVRTLPRVADMLPPEGDGCEAPAPLVGSEQARRQLRRMVDKGWRVSVESGTE